MSEDYGEKIDLTGYYRLYREKNMTPLATMPKLDAETGTGKAGKMIEEIRDYGRDQDE